MPALGLGLGLSRTQISVFTGDVLVPATIAFITATGITDPTIITAINNAVVSWQNEGLWDRKILIRPYVGGTATTNKYNLKNVATYEAVFNGGITHNSNGITGNGTNGYEDTTLPYSALSQDDNSIFVYNRTSGTGSGATLGLLTSANKGVNMYIKFTDNNTYSAVSAVETSLGNIVSNAQGGFRFNRNNSATKELYRNGVRISNVSQASEAVNPSGNLALLASRVNGSILGGTYSNRNLAGFDVGGSYTEAEALTDYNIWQQLQTDLGRAV